jgi:hypothetical protein
MSLSRSSTLLAIVIAALVAGCSGSDPAGSNDGGQGGQGGEAGTLNQCGGTVRWYPAPLIPGSPAECPPCGPPMYVDGGSTTGPTPCTRKGLQCEYRDVQNGGLGASCTCGAPGFDGGPDPLVWSCAL